jgi:hypothetical protein
MLTPEREKEIRDRIVDKYWCGSDQDRQDKIELLAEVDRLRAENEWLKGNEEYIRKSWTESVDALKEEARRG